MGSVVFLVLVAAVVSFGHMHELALRYGETPLNATLIPLSVDAMVVAPSMSVLLASRAGISAPGLPWMLLVIGSLASLAANVEVAEPTLVGRVIAAWPSFAFVAAYHLLEDQLRIRLVGVCSGRPGSWPWRTERRTVNSPTERRSRGTSSEVLAGAASSRTPASRAR